MSLVLRNIENLAIVFDDHKLFADAFGSMLETTRIFKHVSVLYEEKDVAEFLIKEKATENIVLFLDYYIKDNTALNLFRDIKRIRFKCKVIITSTITNPVLIRDLIRYRPNAIISKSSSIEEVIKCLQQIDKGKIYLCPVIQSLLNNMPAEKALALTSREIEIIKHFATGKSAAEVAALLSLSQHTITAHRKKIFRKMSCNSITELLAIARNLDLI
ncbi:MAG: response regulator transcription factor [Niabella sp.]